MNRDLVKAKSAKMARALNEVHGVPVMFRGAMIHVVISNRDGSLDLGNAGFRQSGSVRIRFLESIQPPPRVKEDIFELRTERRYIIVGNPVIAGSALGSEHVVEAELP